MWVEDFSEIEPERRFVALYNDGSGSMCFYKHEDGTITDDEDENYEMDHSHFSHFAYLPDSYKLWGERDDVTASAVDPEAAAI